MVDRIDRYYVVPYATGEQAIHGLRALRAFVGRPAGQVRLFGADRVVVWRAGGILYLSPGAMSLVGYLEPDPDLPPLSPDLCGPVITPARSYPGPAMRPAGTIAADDLPAPRVLMLGETGET